MKGTIKHCGVCPGPLASTREPESGFPRLIGETLCIPGNQWLILKRFGELESGKGSLEFLHLFMLSCAMYSDPDIAAATAISMPVSPCYQD